MLLHPNDTFSPTLVGAKARNLQLLTQAGYNVPAFVVLPADVVKDYSFSAQTLLAAVTQHLKVDRYAVRSAALIEDTAAGSMAGQFLTKLDVSLENLHRACEEVMQHAATVPGQKTADFSLIIQEYIESDSAGVLFTRNPLGGYEMVVEHNQGSGELVVSGSVSNTFSLFNEATLSLHPRQVWAPLLYEQGKAIEQLFDFPQDIEWAYTKNDLYILQARPITNLAVNQYRQYELLTTQLTDEAFYYEQTTLTENFSRPKTLTLSILRKLYAQDGPISAAYQLLGVAYRQTNQFVTIGNQLYINREAETKSLFPALGFLRHGSQTPQTDSFRGFWHTLKNTTNLQRAAVASKSVEVKKLVEFLGKPLDENDNLAQRIEAMLSHYVDIFSINLKSQLALQRLQKIAQSPAQLNEVLENTQSDLDLQLERSSIIGGMLGNSLALDDLSDFVAQDFKPEKDVAGQSTSQYSPEMRQLAIEVQNWLKLRELGRWVSVKLMSHIRRAVQSPDTKEYADAPELIHFATLEEVLAHTLEKGTLERRQAEYVFWQPYEFPSKLQSYPGAKLESNEVVVSPGRMQGTLVTREALETTTGDKILYVTKLSPDLTRYFSDVVGIVSENGGVLSHLGIMAREQSLPVYVTKKYASALGQVVVLGEDAEFGTM